MAQTLQEILKAKTKPIKTLADYLPEQTPATDLITKSMKGSATTNTKTPALITPLITTGSPKATGTFSDLVKSAKSSVSAFSPMVQPENTKQTSTTLVGPGVTQGQGVEIKQGKDFILGNRPEDVAAAEKGITEFTSKYVPIVGDILKANKILDDREKLGISVTNSQRLLASLPVTSTTLVDIDNKAKQGKPLGNQLGMTISNTLGSVTKGLASTAWIIPNAIFQGATDIADSAIPGTRKYLEESAGDFLYGNGKDSKGLKGHLQDTFGLKEADAESATSIASELLNLGLGFIGGKVGQTVKMKGIPKITSPEIRVATKPSISNLAKGVLVESSIQNLPQYAPALYGAIYDYLSNESSLDSAKKVGLNQLAMIGATALAGSKHGTIKSSTVPEKAPGVFTTGEVTPAESAVYDRVSAEAIAPSKTTGKIDVKAFNEFKKTNPNASPSDFLQVKAKESNGPRIPQTPEEITDIVSAIDFGAPTKISESVKISEPIKSETPALSERVAKVKEIIAGKGSKRKESKQEAPSKLQEKIVQERAKRVPVSEILSSKETPTIPVKIEPNMRNVEFFTDMARQNREVGLRQRVEVAKVGEIQKANTDIVQANRMKEMYDNSKTMNEGDILEMLSNDNVLTESNKNALLDRVIALDITANNQAQTRQSGVVEARKTEYTDLITDPNSGLTQDEIIQKIQSDDTISLADRQELISNIAPDKVVAKASETTVLAEDAQTTIPPELQKTKFVESAEADISKSKNISFELGVSQRALQYFKPIDISTTVSSKLFVDIRNKLNNIYVKGKNGVVGLGDAIAGIQSRKIQIVNDAIVQFGMGDFVTTIEGNQALIRSTVKDLQKKMNKYTLGDKRSNAVIEGQLRAQPFEALFSNTAMKDLGYIVNFVNYVKKFHGKDAINELPPEIKGYVDRVNNEFSAKYDEAGVPDLTTKEGQLYQLGGDVLSGEGILRGKSDDYYRGVIFDNVLDFIRSQKKDLGQIGVEQITLENMYQKGYDPTIQSIGDMPKNISSILKRSKNLEIYHSQDPLTRMLSYMDETANLIVNKDSIDLINRARLEQPAVNKYIGKDSEAMVKTMLGLHDTPPALKIINTVGTAISTLAIVPSTSVLAVSAVTTTARGSQVLLRNIIKNRTLGVDIKNTLDVLEKVGIENKYMMNTWGEKVYEIAYSTFGGGYLDQGAKAIIGNTIMRGQLKEMGVDISGMKSSDVPAKYLEALRKQEPEKQNILTSYLAKELSDVSDFSNLSRGQISGLQSRVFNTFKNFGRTAVSRFASYPMQMINEIAIFSKGEMKGSQLAGDITSKLGFIVADTALVYFIGDAIVKTIYGTDDNTKEGTEKKKILVDKLQGGSFPEKISMMILSPFSFPAVSMISGTFNNVVKLAAEIEANGFDPRDAKQYTKISALSRELGLLFSEEETTLAGQYKYSNEWSNNYISNALIFILGFSEGRLDYEVGKRAIDKVVKPDQDLMTKVIGAMFQNQSMVSTLGETAGIIAYPFIPADQKVNSDMFKFFLRTESKNNVNTLLANIKSRQDKPMNVEEYIKNAYEGFEVEIKPGQITSFLPNAVKGNATDARALLSLVDDLGINQNPLYKGDMNKFMEEIKTTNPVMYSSILKKIISPLVLRADKQKFRIGDINFTGQETNAPFVDDLLVNVLGAKRLSSDLADRFMKVISPNATNEDLESYNSVLGVVQRLPYLHDDVIDSISVQFTDKIKNMEGIKEKVQGLGFIQDAIKQAIRLRGVKFPSDSGIIEETATIVQTIASIAKEAKASAQTPTSGQIQPIILPTGPGAPKQSKQKISDLVKAQKKSKAPPLFSTPGVSTKAPLTLAQIIAQSKK